MIEAYKVGVSLGISGNIAQVIEQLIKQFASLDKAIQRTQGEVNSLISGMRAIAREGRAAADAWNQAARAMQSAARAGKSASGSMSGGAIAGPSAAAAAGISAGSYGPGPANSGGQRRIEGPTQPLMLPAPYRSSSTDFQTSGGPYTPYGGYTSGRPPPGPGTAMIPWGSPQTGGTMSGGPYGTGYTTVGPSYYPGGSAVGPFVGGPPGGGGGGGGPPGFLGGPGGPGGIPLAPGPYVHNPNFPNNYSYTPGAGPSLGNGYTAGIMGWGGFEWMKGNWKAAASFDEQKADLLKQDFNPEEVQRASDMAFRLQRKLGTPVPENMHIIGKLMTVTQDKNAALNEDLVEQYAKYQQSVNLHPHGKGGGIADLDAAIRAAEYAGYIVEHDRTTGKSKISLDKASEFVKLLQAEHVVSGGDIGATQTLQLLRSSGGAGAFISQEELMRQMALQIALGSAKAGTSLQGFEQQFTAGRMSEAAANLLIQMDAIKGGGTAKTNPHLVKMGIGQFLLKPGSMEPEVQKLATEEPSRFITEYLLPKYTAYARKAFGKAFDEADDKGKLRMEGQIAQQTASRIPGATEQVEAIRNFLLMTRDVDAVYLALKKNISQIQVENNPFVKSQAMGSAYQGLQIGLGEATMKPATEGMSGIAKALNDISQWSEKHGEITEIALKAFAAGIAALGTAGLVAILTTLGGATGIMAGVGVGAALMTTGVLKLDAALKSFFPGAYKSVDSARADISKGGVKLPWWAPMPSGPGGRDESPDWVKSMGDGLTHPFGPRKSNVPIPQRGDGGGQQSFHLESVSPQAAGTISNGMAGNLSNRFNRPPSGVTGHDPSLDGLAAMNGTN